MLFMETPTPGHWGLGAKEEDGDPDPPLLALLARGKSCWSHPARDGCCLQPEVPFEGGTKLTDQKFSPEAAVSLLKQITSYSSQRLVGSPCAGGKHK